MLFNRKTQEGQKKEAIDNVSYGLVDKIQNI
jgi:hypothetical protein